MSEVMEREVAVFCSAHGVDLADTYTLLLIMNELPISYSRQVLTESAARVISQALLMVNTALNLALNPLAILKHLIDPVRFVWGCLRMHVAHITSLA